jgi:NAD(P)-dependent dehydrogenase (short-subunit alcohol dehydrogenase family)
MESVKGKHILIVGATGTIGFQTARQLAASGATIYISGRNPEKLSITTRELKIPGERSFVCDLTKAGDISLMATTIHAQIPALDILVITSGIGILQPMETLSIEAFEETLQVNLTGPFILLKHFLPAMKTQKKGLIVNVPGVLGKVPMAGAAAYSASKYGLTGMMQSIREELKRTEIRITNLFLGGVDSAFWDSIDLRVQRDKMIVAEEAAKAIWFLCQQPRSGVVSEMVLQPFNHQAI